MKLQDILSTPMSTQQFYDAVKSRMAAIDRKRGWTNRERGQLLSSLFPEETSRLVESADHAVKGMLLLPGSAERFFVGNPPDWFADPLFDAEYVVGLNRMGHWKGLAYAYHLTGDRVYADKVIQEVSDWMDKCAYPGVPDDEAEVFRIYRGIHPWNGLSSGIRMFATWPAIIEQLLDVVTPELLAELAVCMYKHGDMLARACPILHPRAVSNHYIMENIGLLYLTCLLPELHTAEAWRAQAIRELERCAEMQMMPSGGHIEGNPSYHNGCIGWFSIGITLANKHGFAFSDEYTKRIAAGVDYSIHSFRPTGTIVPWGDSDANLAAVHAVLEAYPAFGEKSWLAIFAKLVGSDVLLRQVRGSFSLLWEIDDVPAFVAEIEEMGRETAPLNLPTLNQQYELHQWMRRTSWERDALSVFFACRSPVEGGHSHQDPCGFDFTAYGQPLVVDPGRFCYREDEDRRLFKSATFHNVLTINHREPYDLISSWRYGPQKLGVIEATYEGEGYSAVVGMHRNYEPVIHRRLLAMIEGRFLLVLDRVTADDDPLFSVQIYYHFDSVQTTLDTARTKVHTKDEGSANVLVHTSPNLVGELLAGKVSDHLDQYRDSTRLCLRDYSRENVQRAYATLIVPIQAGADTPQTKSPTVAIGDDIVRCSFELDGVSYEAEWSASDFRFGRIKQQ